MAKPYHDDSKASASSGHFTMVPNDVLEVIVKTNFSSYETRVLCFIIRMTLGWQKECDTIALKQFITATGIKDRRNIDRAVRRLEERRIICVSRDRTKAASYRLNGNLAEWHLASIKTHKIPKGRLQNSVVCIDASASSVLTQQVASVETQGHASPETPSEETLKERKEPLKEIHGKPAGFAEEPKESDSDTKPASKERSLMAAYLDWKASTNSDLPYQKWVGEHA